MVLTVHHLNKSRSNRIVWLLEELDTPYEIKKYQRRPTLQAPQELQDIHPLGKSPVITDGNVVVAETGPIVFYILDKYGSDKLAPAQSDEKLYLRYSYWMHFAEGTAMPTFFNSMLVNIAQSKAPYLLRPIAAYLFSGLHTSIFEPNLKRQTDFLEAELTKNPDNWFVKDFSAADIILSYVVELTKSRIGLDGYPHLQAFLTTVQERPAYKRAVEKTGWPVPKKIPDKI